jgi:peptide/nickel transport system substrate-binding protein
VDIVDDHTVDLRTDRPMSILNNLAFIPVMSRRHVQTMGDRVAESPLGTGPLRLIDIEPGRSIHLSVNEHHQPRPAASEVVFEIHQGESMLPQILQTKPDLGIVLGQAASEGLWNRRVPGLRVVSTHSIYVFYAALNARQRLPGATGPNPLSDVRVRRALALATDREQILGEIFHGHAGRATQLVVPEVFGYDPSITPRTADFEAARKALVEAGYPELKLAILAADDASPDIDQMLIDQWGRAGVSVTRDVRSGAEVLSALEAGSFEINVAGYGCTSADAAEALTFLLQSRGADGQTGLANYTGFSNPELDRIADTNLGIFDLRERLALLQRALRLAHEQVPYIPLFQDNETYVVSERIQWTPRVDAEFRIGDVRFKSDDASGGASR